ncbi:MAG: hypothetical protein PHC34_13210 [Candidatus Gastranaerophilales bacterium]|nr:hypothetical protein [Candidatus Gastranaerophilales bacterium]
MSTTILKNNLQQNIESKSDVDVVDLNVVKVIEEKLIQIFNEDKELDNPVFLFIKEGFIAKLAHFLSGCIKRSVAVGIAGETASGKSTFTLDVLESIVEFQNKYNLEQIVTRINTDDYYYDRSKEVIEAGSFAKFAQNYDLDVPAAFELDLLKNHIEQLVLGKEVWLPKYDMSGTAIRNNMHSLAKPNKVIVSEGLFNLSDGIKDVFDFCIYVDVESEEQKDRFYKRAAQRGLGDSAERVYDNAVSKAEIYVKPTLKNADVVISGMVNREDYKIITKKLLDLVISTQKAYV